MVTALLEAGIMLGAAVLAGMIIRHPKTVEKGIGPRTIQALTVVIGTAAVVVLAMCGLVNNPAVAALLGGVLGIGISSRGQDSN